MGLHYLFETVKAEIKQRKEKNRKEVETTNIPGKWKHFLHINENIHELFSFLVNRGTAMKMDKQILSTDHKENHCHSV